MKKNFDYSISLCRITAMIMIVICHFGTALGSSLVGESFQVGVYLFLFISGYLYGNREIDNYYHWIKERFIRIYIPFYIFVGYTICLNIIISKKIDIIMVILSFFNLQGYHHIFNKMYYHQPIEGSAHLWYLTVLVLCYLFTITIKKIEKKRKLDKNEIVLFLLGLLLISCVLGLKGIRIDYLFTYLVGYFYSRRKGGYKSDYYVSILFLIIACSMRLSMKRYCDIYGDNNLYLYVIIPLSYNLLSFWIFKTVMLFSKYLNKFYENTIFRKIMLSADSLSFYIYITHYQFIDGPISLLFVTPKKIIDIFIICVLTIIGSIILKISSEIIANIIYPKERRHC